MGARLHPLKATLTYEDVLGIHEVLVRDFAESADPISPSGVRETGDLLHSAVARQSVGYGGTLKHPDVHSNAATLCYGVCCNHAFHNGNKRTALVALLCHLDRNGFTLNGEVNQDELYSFMLKIASHKFAPKKSVVPIPPISRWLRLLAGYIAMRERFGRASES